MNGLRLEALFKNQTVLLAEVARGLFEAALLWVS
jgi:hypothetical protein